MRGKTWWLALLCGAILALPASAQEGAGSNETPAQAPAQAEEKETPPAPETTKKKASLGDPPLHRWGGWTISLAGWSPSRVGAVDQIAVVFPPDGDPAYPLALDSSSNIRESWLVAYHLPKNLGSIVFHYDSMHFEDRSNFSTPGEFIYGESRAMGEFRGAFDDGLADGVGADTSHKTREVRLEFSDTAWETKHTHATWGAGLRNVDNNDLVQISYVALVPNLPPVIPPIIDPAPNPAQWAPRPDVVTEQSDFSGTGVGASLDVEFRLHPRFSIVSGLSIGLLRGKLSTGYESVTSYYFTSTEPIHILTKDELFEILQTGTKEEIQSISQEDVVNNFNVRNGSQAAQTFDAYIGVQSAVWRGLKVFLTMREMYYQNVAGSAVLTQAMMVETQSKSVGFEGYLVGLSWRF